MNSNSEHHYRVFLSYAHADAQTDAGKMLIASFKEQINAALQSAAGKDLVFLDSEALEWGDEWSARITECLQQCKVFVCLLSPNYQKSAYCKRERLMWERKEIRLGRLRKGTYPVYYIKLEDSKYEELLASQMDDAKPFFESLDEIRQDIVAKKIKRVRDISKQIKNKELTEEQAESIAVGFFRISPFFVGRLGELAELCEFIKDHIPIVSGGAGVGKTELAVAYASGYAELYPQGRFLLHMEGVNDWNQAIVNFVEKNALSVNSIKEILCLPENFDKLSIEDKRMTVVQRLWKCSQKGKLLLILDNLENLSLVSDSGLTRLYDGVGDLPGNVDIMATTRNSEFGKIERIKALEHKTPSSRGLPFLYEINNLDTASAFELFCHISDHQFPFAKCNPEKLKKNVRKEYLALMKIIDLLNGHAWSLEIIAGFMKENTRDDFTFQSKFEEIKKNTSGIIDKGNYKYRNMAVTPEKLLQPTFDYIVALDEGCGIGTKILELATIAAFFPPDMVSDEALLGYWKKYYSDSVTEDFDDGKFALSQLHALHLINGEGCISKMHRLTRDVLLNRLTEDKQFDIVKLMQQYWDEFKNYHYDITLSQVQPWTGWVEEWLVRLPLLQQDEAYLQCMGNISNESQSNNLYMEAEKCYSLVIENACKLGDQLLKASGLIGLANVHDSLNQLRDAEHEYGEALDIYRKLAISRSGYNESYVASALNNIALFHSNLNRYKEAENEYEEALRIYKRLALAAPDKYDSDVADTLDNIANFHADLNRPEDADREYHEALAIRRCLAKACPALHESNLAMTLNNLAIFHKNQNRPMDSAKYYEEALDIYHRLSKSSPDRYEAKVAATLNNLALLHAELNRPKDAEREYGESLVIYQHLAESNPNPYNSYLAGVLSNLANLHADQNNYKAAIREYNDSLKIRRSLAKTCPDRYDADIALTLDNLASLHYDLKYFIKAEKEFGEALEIRRQLAASNPERYDADVAKTLNGLALLHKSRKRFDEAEREYGEALSIRRSLAKSSPDHYESDVADTLNNLGLLHEELNRLEVAEDEYNEALLICRRLAASNPDRYDFDVADTLCNLANLHANNNHADDTERELSEALKMFRSLLTKSPDRFENYVATTLDNLAELHLRLGRFKESECEYDEALEIYQRLAKKKTSQYKSDVARLKKILPMFRVHMKHSDSSDTTTLP